MMKKNVIELTDIFKSYGNVKAVDGISLQVNKGEVFGLLAQMEQANQPR